MLWIATDLDHCPSSLRLRLEGLTTGIRVAFHHILIASTELSPSRAREALRKDGPTGDLCIIGQKRDLAG